jgi:hypothetical protein
MEEVAMMFVEKREGEGLAAGSIPLAIIAAIVVFLLNAGPCYAAKQEQKTFRSPGEAFAALIEAVRAGETKQIAAILGPGSKDVFHTGDAETEEFVRAYDQKRVLEHEGPNKVVLVVGPEAWPWSIPVVKVGRRWRFDMKEGKREILARRIGADEVAAVQVCLAYVDAQREYAQHHEVNGLMEYAQKFTADEGTTDGLCWEGGEGDETSPLGPQIANACRASNPGNSQPYHGYFYNILKKQGPNAPGGAYDYVIDGKMIGGFGLVAYPAFYGASGVMTFIVNQDGKVYQRNLGKDTVRIAEAMRTFDPDKTWKKVE